MNCKVNARLIISLFPQVVMANCHFGWLGFLYIFKTTWGCRFHILRLLKHLTTNIALSTLGNNIQLIMQMSELVQDHTLNWVFFLNHNYIVLLWQIPSGCSSLEATIHIVSNSLNCCDNMVAILYIRDTVSSRIDDQRWLLPRSVAEWHSKTFVHFGPLHLSICDSYSHHCVGLQ